METLHLARSATHSSVSAALLNQLHLTRASPDAWRLLTVSLRLWIWAVYLEAEWIWMQKMPSPASILPPIPASTMVLTACWDVITMVLWIWSARGQPGSTPLRQQSTKPSERAYAHSLLGSHHHCPMAMDMVRERTAPLRQLSIIPSQRACAHRLLGSQHHRVVSTMVLWLWTWSVSKEPGSAPCAYNSTYGYAVKV